MCGIGSDWIAAARNAENADAQFLGPKETDARRALIIFVKNPQLGKVKTRLAKSMGDEAALAAYLQMLSHMRDVTAGLDCHRAVYYSDFIDEGDAWTSPTYSKHLQSPGDLGDKMRLAMKDMYALGYKHVALVGSDLLDLQVQHLQEAFRALKFHDVVLGPASDGGYYLIGMNEIAPSVFQRKAWSTAHVLADTLSDIRQIGKSVYLLPELNDIDEEEDWIVAFARHQRRNP